MHRKGKDEEERKGHDVKGAIGERKGDRKTGERNKQTEEMRSTRK